jgi:hypothetical protein
MGELVERVRRLTRERRELVAELERLRAVLAKRGGLADYYNWRRPLLVRGRGVYSAWGVDQRELVGR